MLASPGRKPIPEDVKKAWKRLGIVALIIVVGFFAFIIIGVTIASVSCDAECQTMREQQREKEQEREKQMEKQREQENIALQQDIETKKQRCPVLVNDYLDIIELGMENTSNEEEFDALIGATWSGDLTFAEYVNVLGELCGDEDGQLYTSPYLDWETKDRVNEVAGKMFQFSSP